MRIWERLPLNLLVITIIGFLFTVSSINRSAVAGTDPRPNIVLILTDDQDEPSMAFMPNLQELLVDHGTTFKNFIFNVSLCCPSRASILRGQYAHNHQVITNRSPFGGFRRFLELGHEESTIATWLQDAGYRTVFLGKYMNEYPRGAKRHVPPGWNEWYAITSGHYRNYELNENGDIVPYDGTGSDYQTDLLARKAADFIRRSAGKSPFFIHLSTFASHKPHFPAPRHRSAFKTTLAPRPPSFNEEDVGDKPGWVRDNGVLTEADISEIDDRFRDRVRTLLAVDDLIKTLIDELTANGELENTYIFYATDNGFEQGEHRIETGKNAPYEESIRVPLVVRGPAVPYGQTVGHLISNIDIAPTFATLGNAPVPAFIDGFSFAPVLTDQPPAAESWRNAVLVQHWQFEGAGGSIRDYRGVRTMNHLYVEYASDEFELYDLRSDPYQLRNSYAAADSNLVEELAMRVRQLEDCTEHDCFLGGRLTPFLKVARPNGGENFQTGQTESIEWDTDGSAVAVELEYSADEGSSWSTIVASTPNDGQFEWTVPDTTGAGVLIRISDAGDPTLNDVSDGPFSIHDGAQAPVIHAFSPLAGPSGTHVTIIGNRLVTVRQISFGGVLSADISVVSEDTVTAIVPAGSSTGPIAVANDFGTTITETDFTVVPADPKMLLFTPSDDTFVRSQKPTNNYGDWLELRVRKSSSSRTVSYLKFDVIGVAGGVTSAKLQLQITDGSDDGGAVYPVSNQFKDGVREWNESELVWTNAPEITEPALSSSAGGTVGQVLEFDVTAAVAGNGTYSFAVRNESSDALRLAPKELKGAQAPALLITAIPEAISPPVVSSFEPTQGSPGIEVIIFGEHFATVTEVAFNGTKASFVVDSDTTILAQVPIDATSGRISVTAQGSIGSSPSEFTVIADSIPPSQTLIFRPTEDASVWEKKPTRNYGSDPVLRVRHNPRVKAISYFKFSITGLVGEISSAKLRFHVADGSDDAGSVYLTSTNFVNSGIPWVEGDLTWENAPSVTGNALSSQGASEPGETIEFDVAEAVTGNGVVSFAVVNESNDALMLSSKESAQPPELVITTKDASTTLARTSVTDPSSSSISQSAQASDNIQLLPSFPNPFNLTTRIQYRLTETEHVRLLIYNIRGREVRRLVEAEQSAGLKTVWWNGTDRLGREIGSGIYLVRLRVGSQTFTNKLVLQK
jgi:arylsulfatase A-like enzyme